MRMNRSTLRLAATEYPVGSPDLGYFDPITAIVGSSAIGGIGQALGARKAAKTAANAEYAGQAMQREMFDQSRQDQMPWMQAGEAGLNQYAAMLGLRRGGGGWNGDPNSFTYDPATAAQSSQMMQADPGYQFRLNEGRKTIENSAAARGGLLSGNTARALSDYGQQSASDEWSNILNRYANLAGVGQTQANNQAAARQNLGNSFAGSMTNVGNARASGYAGMGNAISDATGNAALMYGYKQGWFGKK